MDIHKPKAAHSWREFAVEIGTIICGILIALGLEQGIDGLHKGSEVREARAAIRGEIARNLDVFRRRAEVQPCIDARLHDLESLLVSAPMGSNLPRPLWVGRPQVWNVRDSRWAAATSGARTALLSGEEQAGYGEVYGLLREFDDAQKIEQLAWAHLRELETLPQLDVQSRAHLIGALHEARYGNFRIIIAGKQADQRSKAIKVEVEHSPYEEGSRSACVPMNTPRDQALLTTIKGRTAIAEP